MTEVYLVLGALVVGVVGGYLLATHMHSIAARAASAATDAMNKAVANIPPNTPPAA